MKDLAFALKSGFGWLSTISVGISMEGIEALMRHVYVFPLVGLVLGGILGGAAYIAGQVLPVHLVAVVVIVAIYKLCGINHIDGLADFGDGVIADVCAVPGEGFPVAEKLQAEAFAGGLEGVEVVDFEFDLGDVAHGVVSLLTWEVTAPLSKVLLETRDHWPG